MVPWPPLHVAHPGKMLQVPNLLVRGLHPHPNQLLSQEPSQQKGIGTLRVCRPPLSQALGNMQPFDKLLCARDRPHPWVPLSPAQARGLTTGPVDGGELGGGRRKAKSMHVNSVGNLFSSSEEGIYKEARREIKSYKHIYAIFLRGPFLD